MSTAAPAAPRVALVTGAAGDIGAMLVHHLLDAGWDVLAVDIDGPGMAQALAAARGDRLLTLVADLTVPAEVVGVAQAVARRSGRLEAIVANAGGSRGETIPFLDLTPERWQAIIDRNLTSVHLTCWTLAPLMGSGGTIVVTSSELALLVLPGFTAYAAAKGGVQQLVRGMAVDLAPLGIRVNAVAPGPTLTAGTRERFTRPDVQEQLRRTVPLGRPALPEELLGAYLLLLGPGSTAMTGATVTVDGGLSAL